MNLDFTEEQQMLRDTTRGVCAQHVPTKIVRLMEDDEAGYPAVFWAQLAELGIAGLTLPEDHGGMGWGSVDTVVVYEEFGRAQAPSPHFVSCVLSAKILELAGSTAQQENWLPQIATGEAIITPAWHEPHAGFGAEGIQLRATQSANGYVLSGAKFMVPFASTATRLLVLARTGDASGDVIGLLVDPHATGVSLHAEKNHASQNLWQVNFDQVQVSAEDALTNNFWAAWDEAMTVSVIALAAQAIGGAEAIHALTVDYAKQRVQFGKPIGSFQSIAHYLADLQVDIAGAKILVYQAAWARDNGKPYHRLAAMAKLQACNVFRKAATVGVQVHGGYGFTSEGDPQLYFRRAKHQQVTWWDSAYLEQRIAACVLDDACA